MATIVFSKDAQEVLKDLHEVDPKLAGRILAAINDTISTWDPGEEDGETIRHLANVSRNRQWDVYRLKLRKELGPWRVFFYRIDRPREVVIGVIVEWRSNDATYDDPKSSHVKLLARQIEELVLQGRIDRKQRR